MGTKDRDTRKQEKGKPRGVRRASRKTKSKSHPSPAAKFPPRRSARKTGAPAAKAKPARKRPPEARKTPGTEGRDVETGGEANGQPNAAEAGGNTWESLYEASPWAKKGKVPANKGDRGEGAIPRRMRTLHTGNALEAGDIDDLNPWTVSSDMPPNEYVRKEESRLTPKVENADPSCGNRDPTPESPTVASPETEVGSPTDAPSAEGDADEETEAEAATMEDDLREAPDVSSATVRVIDGGADAEDVKERVAKKQIGEDMIAQASLKGESQLEIRVIMADQEDTEIQVDETADSAEGTMANDKGGKESPFEKKGEAAKKECAVETEKWDTATERKTVETRVKMGQPNEIPVEDLASGVVNALGNGLGHVLHTGNLVALGIVSGIRAGANVAAGLGGREGRAKSVRRSGQ